MEGPAAEETAVYIEEGEYDVEEEQEEVMEEIAIPSSALES